MGNRLLDYGLTNYQNQILDNPATIAQFLTEFATRNPTGRAPTTYGGGNSIGGLVPNLQTSTTPSRPGQAPNPETSRDFLARAYYEAYPELLGKPIAANAPGLDQFQAATNDAAALARQKDSGNIFTKAAKNLGTFVSAASGLGGFVGGLGSLLTGGSLVPGVAGGVANVGNAIKAVTGLGSAGGLPGIPGGASDAGRTAAQQAAINAAKLGTGVLQVSSGGGGSGRVSDTQQSPATPNPLLAALPFLAPTTAQTSTPTQATQSVSLPAATTTGSTSYSIPGLLNLSQGENTAPTVPGMEPQQSVTKLLKLRGARNVKADRPNWQQYQLQSPLQKPSKSYAEKTAEALRRRSA